MSLEGASVVVAGAGLAGLAAARDLSALGAKVTIVDSRGRVGGRVWTIRAGFAERQHAEAGADFIDGQHREIRRLAAEVGLEVTRVLRLSFAYVRADGSGRPRIVRRGAGRGWDKLAERLAPAIRPYR